MSKRAEQLDTFVTQESFVFEQAQNFMSEQCFCSDGIDIGNGQPLTLFIPDAARGKAMSMRVRVQDTAKYLRTTTTPGCALLSPAASLVSSLMVS